VAADVQEVFRTDKYIVLWGEIETLFEQHKQFWQDASDVIIQFKLTAEKFLEKQ
jgi:hypothetical protein